ncbi:unnamed protein product [Cyprideis torosa]|uniref:Uncharacterized protein n=1 Tax=Cyprideis torosa TaxID=163714 RepID=A0A7R8ZT12_9CRUS|nr:unnamed protein product [Cyprideis torosa]CAG0906875.1 unnamed protein product [Cyprideis torosa]
MFDGPIVEREYRLIMSFDLPVGSDVVGLEFYSPKKEDGDRILVVSAEGCASVILKTSGETERKWNLDCVPSCMFWDPVTQVLAVGSSSGHVSIFLQDAPITKVPSMHEGFVSSIGILGRFLVSGGSDGSIQVWR